MRLFVVPIGDAAAFGRMGAPEPVGGTEESKPHVRGSACRPLVTPRGGAPTRESTFPLELDGADVATQFQAFVADERPRSSKQRLHLAPRLPAERAAVRRLDAFEERLAALDEVRTRGDAAVADVHRRAGDEVPSFGLRPVTERAGRQLVVRPARHRAGQRTAADGRTRFPARSNVRQRARGGGGSSSAGARRSSSLSTS